jgi:uncharacterized SAM-binding protein YcdF (DUF218 family)
LRFFGKVLLIPAALILLVSIAQLCAFFFLADNNKTLRQADIIVAFPGGKEREQTAWTLAEQDLAPNLVVINSTSNRLKYKAEQYKINKQLHLLEGGTSRSTFEDVYIAVEVIREQGLKSAILITSSYHMPRSLFLFKTHLLCLGMNIDVQFFPVIAADKKRLAVKVGIYYNELIKSWGSILELTGYHLSGRFMNDSPWFQKANMFVHKYLIYGQ